MAPSMEDLPVVVGRIDERTTLIQNELRQVNKRLSTDYVTHSEFHPIKVSVYGVIATVGAAVIAAILALVFVGDK